MPYDPNGTGTADFRSWSANGSLGVVVIKRRTKHEAELDNNSRPHAPAVLKPARQLPGLLGSDGKGARNFILDPPGECVQYLRGR